LIGIVGGRLGEAGNSLGDGKAERTHQPILQLLEGMGGLAIAPLWCGGWAGLDAAHLAIVVGDVAAVGEIPVEAIAVSRIVWTGAIAKVY
jgi:hypothetical protein